MKKDKYNDNGRNQRKSYRADRKRKRRIKLRIAENYSSNEGKYGYFPSDYDMDEAITLELSSRGLSKKINLALLKDFGRAH